jgi:hypothetical protein
VTGLASLLASWRADPDRPIAEFGLSIVLLDNRPNWSAGDERAPLSEYDLRFVGNGDLPQQPQQVSRSDRRYLLETAAFGVGPPLRHVRLKCGECLGGSMPRGEVAKAIDACSAVACPLWPFRLGFDPRREPVSEEQREVARARALRHGLGRRPQDGESCEEGDRRAARHDDVSGPPARSASTTAEADQAV